MTARRRPGVVSVTALLGLVLTLGVAELLIPQWSTHLGLDVWNWGDTRVEAQQQEQEALAVEAQRVQLRREIESAGHVVAKLREGQVTLAQATDELEPLMRHRRGFEYAWPIDPPPTFRHSVARYATTRVEAELANDPARQAAICARLKAEYNALK